MLNIYLPQHLEIVVNVCYSFLENSCTSQRGNATIERKNMKRMSSVALVIMGLVLGCSSVPMMYTHSPYADPTLVTAPMIWPVASDLVNSKSVQSDSVITIGFRLVQNFDGKKIFIDNYEFGLQFRPSNTAEWKWTARLGAKRGTYTKVTLAGTGEYDMQVVVLRLDGSVQDVVKGSERMNVFMNSGDNFDFNMK